MTLLELPFFDLIAGLPVHPLVVHAVVVLLPLACVSLLVLAVRPSLRGRWLFPTLVILAVSAGAAVVAKESGVQLAMRVNLPEQHAKLGEALAIAAVATFALALAWSLLLRRDATRRARNDFTASMAPGLGAVVVALAAAASLGLTVAAGHTGAQAAWGQRVTQVPAAHVTPAASGPISAETVAQHATVDDCWTTIDGSVYDLTAWAPAHPGGRARIAAICGQDGSAAFNGEHRGKASIAERLAAFRIGAAA